ncbi:MAG: hypothetical protein H6741_22190 [Alphaproteobacteria bacterium]|nr:hypothetical protein [Alphaproteobacteria bacterium]
MIDGELSLTDAIAASLPAFGGKATNMAAMTLIGDPVPTAPCFGVPMYWYDKHMRDNGLWERYDALTQEPDWGEPQARAEHLQAFMEEVHAAPIDPELVSLVVDKVGDRFLRARARFRSSTNAEDLGNFTGAGLYTSNSGDWSEDGEDISDAIRTVWASVWGPRAWEEREYWGITHTDVGMALLVNPTFQDEQANGVAVTGNVFDTAGLEPAFYINVQQGEASVVIPEDGTTTDQLLYYYSLPGQPVVYIAHSNQVLEGETVLSNAELYELGTALDAIHRYFYPVYGTQGGFYAMDTEFKFTVSGSLMMKQARPYPGWSVNQ